MREKKKRERECEKKPWEKKQRETLKINKNALLHGENKMSSSENEKKKNKPPKNKTKQTKPNKDGLGGRRATSPDPYSEKETNRPKTTRVEDQVRWPKGHLTCDL